MDTTGERLKEMDLKMMSSFMFFSSVKDKINSDNVEWLRNAQEFSNELLKVYLITNEDKIYVK